MESEHTALGPGVIVEQPRARTAHKFNIVFFNWLALIVAGGCSVAVFVASLLGYDFSSVTLSILLLVFAIGSLTNYAFESKRSSGLMRELVKERARSEALRIDRDKWSVQNVAELEQLEADYKRALGSWQEAYSELEKAYVELEQSVQPVKTKKKGGVKK